MLYHNLSINETFDEKQTSEQGLSKTEAVERLRVYGPNVLHIKTEPLWRKLTEPFANVFMLVLFIAVIISFLHHSIIDATIIIVIMTVSATIYYIQRFSTDHILRSLQRRSEHTVSVLRDGNAVEIRPDQLVPGDVVTLEEGDKVPADIRFTSGENVRTDESLLTGESTPVSKSTDELVGDKEVYEQSNILFQGSFIVSGVARGVVVQTGNLTEFGKIAALSGNQSVQSPVQKKIDVLIGYIIAAVAGMAAVAFALAIIRGVGFTEALQFVIALSVSAVPESLPVAISIILVLGMRRMANKKALVRNMRAIESVGILTTIATDKTGTLTKNKLTVQTVWQPRSSKLHLASIVHHSVNNNHTRKLHDPLDTALIEFTSAERVIRLGGEPLKKLPFDQSVSMSGNVWHHAGVYHLVVKGAPEQILARSIMSKTEHEEAEAALQDLTQNGYRVVALASTVTKQPIEGFHELRKKPHLTFAGFVAVADILRTEAAPAIAAAQAAGVSVRMITGDHFETAFHIGKQLGLIESRDQVFDSRKMATMSDHDVLKQIDNIKIFSRVVPENKYRILELLKRKNVTAMTGDGVNDVPALTNAHVGVAMGSGSQIAKDASDIILLDNNFRSIITAMHEGRIIFSNIRRMLYYLLSTSGGEALTMVASLAIGVPLPLVPVQILWVNLVTDTAMVIPLGLEPGERGIMKRAPLPANAPILNKYMISRIILVAVSMAATVLVLYITFSNLYGHAYGSTIAFSALVVIQWSNALNARSDFESIFMRLRRWSWPFWIGLTIAMTVQFLAMFGPLGQYLNVTEVAIVDLIVTGLIAFIIPIILVEIHKFIGRKIYGISVKNA